MRARVLCMAASIVGLLAGCTHAPVGPRDHYYRVVSLPEIALQADPLERIDAVEVRLACGRIVAINHIPCDWSVAMTSPISERTTLRLEAGHGSTSLCSSRALDGFLTILVSEPSCFDIAVSVSVSSLGDERRIRLKQSDLSLVPLRE